MPLVLGMRLGDVVTIGDDIRITFIESNHDGIRLLFDAPKEVPILRGNAKVKFQVKNRNGPLVTIGIDERGFCLCGRDTPCPLGKSGSDSCCSRSELIEAGVQIHEQAAVVEDYRDCHGGHTNGGII